MNVFKKVTKRNLKLNRARSAATVIGIALSTAMIVGVMSLIVSLQHFLLDLCIRKTGDWEVLIQSLDHDGLESLKEDPRVKDFFLAEEAGYSYFPGLSKDKDPYVFVLGMAEDPGQTASVRLIKGRFPLKAGEIIVPEHMLRENSISLKIGEPITLRLSDRMLGEEKLGRNIDIQRSDADKGSGDLDERLVPYAERRYEVTGIYERAEFETHGSPGYVMISGDKADVSRPVSAFVHLKDRHEAFAFEKDFSAFDCRVNEELLRLSGITRFASVNSALAVIVLILLGVIVIGSIALIYNAFAISVSERTGQFGLMASIGATSRQIRQMVLYESMILALIGIPLGLAGGLGGIALTLYILDRTGVTLFGNGEVRLTLDVSWPALLLSVLLTLAVILISAHIPARRAARSTAVEAIRHSKDIKYKKVRTSRLSARLFGLPGMISSRYYKRSSKRYRATIISLAMSVLLFVAATSFSDILFMTFNRTYAKELSDLEFHFRDDGKTAHRPSELKAEIEKMDAVEEVSYSFAFDSQIRVKAESLRNADQWRSEDLAERNDFPEDEILCPLRLIFMDSKSFGDYLKENGLKKEQAGSSKGEFGALILNSFMASSEDGQGLRDVEYFNDSAEGFELMLPKSLEGMSFCGIYQDEEKGLLLNYIGKEENTQGSDSAKLISIPYHKEHVLDVPCSILKLSKKAPRGFDRFYNAAAFLPLSEIRLLEERGADFAEKNYIFRLRAPEHKKAFGELQSYLIDQGIPAFIFDRAKEAKEVQNLIVMVKVFTYGFITLIALISVANVFNTITTNIKLRRKDFAMLRSVGMTYRSLRRMLLYECLLYGSRAVLIGWILSLLFSLLLLGRVESGFGLAGRLPYLSMLLAALIVFITVGVTMLYASGKLKKENLLDTLKNENY